MPMTPTLTTVVSRFSSFARLSRVSQSGHGVIWNAAFRSRSCSVLNWVRGRRAALPEAAEATDTKVRTAWLGPQEVARVHSLAAQLTPQCIAPHPACLSREPVHKRATSLSLCLSQVNETDTGKQSWGQVATLPRPDCVLTSKATCSPPAPRPAPPPYTSADSGPSTASAPDFLEGITPTGLWRRPPPTHTRLGHRGTCMQLLAVSWPSPGCCDLWGVNQPMQSSLLVSVSPYNSDTKAGHVS